MVPRNNSEDNDVRFSDEMLIEFRDEFEQHVQHYEARIKTDDARFQTLISIQERNTEAIQQLIEETKGIIQLHRDLQGATRIGSNVQKFGIWLTKWGMIGVGILTMVNWSTQILERFLK